MKATPFQEQVVAAYVAENNANPKSALRNVKRWFSHANANREIRPGPQWRSAIRAVLGEDPFSAPEPWDLRDRLEVLEEAFAKMAESRADLLEIYESRIRELESAVARLADAGGHQGAGRN